MTLPRSALELYRDGYPTIAVLVLGPIVGIPALMLATLVALVVPLRAGRNAPWLVGAGRLLFLLSPWSMVEVLLIGVLVSLVKIGAMATVVLGIAREFRKLGRLVKADDFGPYYDLVTDAIV